MQNMNCEDDLVLIRHKKVRNQLYIYRNKIWLFI